jgi:hypothetical protein
VILLFLNTYTDPDPARNAELQDALSRNRVNPLVNVVEIPGRPTFAMMFAYMRAHTARDDVGILANADIYLDETAELFGLIGERECWACSRWENGGCYNRPDSQDAWAFRGPPPDIPADFSMGELGCDNRLARMIRDAGYKVVNPALSVKCHHLHASNVRRYSRGQTRTIRGLYLTIWPSKLAGAAV